MPTISRQAIVPFSAAQMYTLVNAVEDYPTFLPWCRSSEILMQNQDEMHARLEVAKAGFQKSFTTCNRLQKDKLIEIRLVDGPFEHLEGFWRFNPLSENSCQVLFDIEFKVAGKIASLTLGPVFNQAANSLVEAFCQRARVVYGTDK